jgi:hypothetical protein
MAAPPETRATLGIVRGADHEAKRNGGVERSETVFGGGNRRRSRPRRKRWEGPERTE